MIRLLSLLRHDRNGSAAVEFGLVAPVFLTMLLGVFQVGIWLQAYNAMRNAVAETSRSVAVEYQTDNKLSDSQIANTGLAVATTAPYLLKGDKIEVEVEDAATQSFAGATEKQLTVTYTMPTFLGFAGIDGPTVSYSRAMFLLND